MPTPPKKLSWPLIGNDALGAILVDLSFRALLPSVMLFLGPAHSGKTTAALWLAHSDICSQPTTSGLCGVCSDCRVALAGNHPRLNRLPLEEGGSIGIDDVRQTQHFYTLASWNGEHRWLVISDAERMTEAATNALLKFLEEPPPQLHIILTSSQPDRLLSTLISRASIFRWHFVSTEAIQVGLQARFPQHSQNSLQALATEAAGRPGAAMRAAADTTFREEETGTRDELLEQFSRLRLSARDSRDGQAQIARMDMMEQCLREILLARAGDRTRMLWPDLQDQINDISQSQPLEEWLAAAERSLRRHEYILANVQPTFVYDDILLA